MLTQMRLHQDCLEPIVNKIYKKEMHENHNYFKLRLHTTATTRILLFISGACSHLTLLLLLLLLLNFGLYPTSTPLKTFRLSKILFAFILPSPPPTTPWTFLGPFSGHIQYAVYIKLFLELPCLRKVKILH